MSQLFLPFSFHPSSFFTTANISKTRLLVKQKVALQAT